MRHVKDSIDLILAVLALAGVVASWIRWGQPRFKDWLEEKRADKAAFREVFYGTADVPANPLTGAAAVPGRKPLGQVLADIDHELHPNSGKSMKDVVDRTETKVDGVVDDVTHIKERLADGDAEFTEIKTRLDALEAVLRDELLVATDTVANAAEASRAALSVIDAAIHAEPPAAGA